MRKQDLDLIEDLKSMAAKGALTGAFSDIPIEVYHLGPGASSSNLKPIIARLEGIEYDVPEDSQALRFGNAFHTYMLEREEFEARYQVGFAHTDRTKLFLTTIEFETIRSMAASLTLDPKWQSFLAHSKNEVTFYAVCRETGVLQKARADKFQDLQEINIVDLKTTISATKQSFIFAARKFMYRESASYYLKVIGEALDKCLRNFFLVACEKASTYKVGVYRVSPRSLADGHERIMAALKMIQRIKEVGEAEAWKEKESEIQEINL